MAFRNFGEGRARGVEMWGCWHPSDSLHVSGGLVLQSISTALSAGSKDSAGETGMATNDPNRHWLLRVSKDISERSQLDLSLRYQGSLPKLAVPAYYEMDARWVWMFRPDTEISVIVQNVLHRSHVEFRGGANRSVFERGVLLKLTQRF